LKIQEKNLKTVKTLEQQQNKDLIEVKAKHKQKVDNVGLSKRYFFTRRQFQ
jgi:hypothetical protein